MITLLKDEKELIAKYGKVVVKFKSYYKFWFNFIADLDNGDTLLVNVGGESADIYRLEINDKPLTVEQLVNDIDVNYMNILDNKGNCKVEYHG